MELKQKQLASQEQEIVLRTLAESVARHGCHFLEIGSWLGNSTIILGKVAQKYNGWLFCVDWWKGNIGTDLVDIAEEVDIFSLFWKKICQEGLEEVIIPIRAQSKLAAEILKQNQFDFVFLDADHRYESILNDIKHYAALVSKNNGILCGHDCEGRISDYDRQFLENGKNVDFYETVHCGVVLAVNTVFEKFSINHSIWSVCYSTQQGMFCPTNIDYTDIYDAKQSMPPFMGFSKNYVLFRFGKFVYALSREQSKYGVKNKEDVLRLKSYMECSWKKIEEQIKEPVILQVESFRHYMIYELKGIYYALLDSLNGINLFDADERVLNQYKERNALFIASDIFKVKQMINYYYQKDKRPGDNLPVLVEEYLNFNIVQFEKRYYGIAHTLGKLDLSDPVVSRSLNKYQNSMECFIGNSIAEVKHLISQFLFTRIEKQVLDQKELVQQLHENLKRKDTHIIDQDQEIRESKEQRSLIHKDLLEKKDKIKNLQETIAEQEQNIVKGTEDNLKKEEELDVLRKEVIVKENRIEQLLQDFQQKEKDIIVLTKDLESQRSEINQLRMDLASKEENEKNIQNDLANKEENLIHLKRNVQEYQDQIQILQQNIDEKEKDLTLIKRNVQEYQDQIKTLQQNIDEKEKDLILTNKEKENTTLKSNTEFFEMHTHIAELHDELVHIHSQWWFKVFHKKNKKNK